MPKPYFQLFSLRSTGLPHMDPIMGGAQQCRAGYTYGPVMRQYYIMEYICRGKGEYTVNGQTFAAEAGQAFLIRPYEVHLLRADETDPWEYIWIGFSTDLTLPRVLKENYVFAARELADRLFLNRSYFGALFKKRTGKTPKAYIDECRLSAATKLMSELGYTVTQAALATGYGDVMRFSKMYKRHYGISPRQSIQKRSAQGKTIYLK